jgi:subtilisin family serine protease
MENSARAKRVPILQGEGVVVAVIDTGGDYIYEDLTEDVNGNGTLDAGEDQNGNGVLDSKVLGCYLPRLLSTAAQTGQVHQL